MQLKQLFTPVQSITPDTFRAFLKQQREGAYNLLDVRQPKEYEQMHIPGARLKPLSELEGSLSDVDPGKPTVVYCAVGGRSRVASQLLSGKGFSEVYNLKGGIKAWSGSTAAGPAEMNLSFISGDETPSQMMAIAYEMEAGLGLFYTRARDTVTDPELSELLSGLIHFEDSHRKVLLSMITDLPAEEEKITEIIKDELAGTMEAGFPIHQFLSDNRSFMRKAEDLLQLALMVEAQALDLYLRFSEKIERDDTREALYRIAGEERKHLAVVARLFERRLGT